MKNFLILLFIFTAFAPPAHSYDNRRPINLNFEPQGPSEQEIRCARKIAAMLGGRLFFLSRIKSMEYRTPEGSSINDGNAEHPFNNCENIDIGEVSAFSTGYKHRKDFNISVALLKEENKSGYLSTYKQNKAYIDNLLKEKKFRKLEDGTREIIWKDIATMYVLPDEISKTANGEPVVIYCTFNRKKENQRICNSKYIHPDGVGFSYTYIENPGDDHFGLDIAIRKRYEGLKATPEQERAFRESISPTTAETPGAANTPSQTPQN